eukprot:10114368-Lingulodinium_polyedra.AAC.1
MACAWLVAGFCTPYARLAHGLRMAWLAYAWLPHPDRHNYDHAPATRAVVSNPKEQPRHGATCMASQLP